MKQRHITSGNIYSIIWLHCFKFYEIKKVRLTHKHFLFIYIIPRITTKLKCNSIPLTVWTQRSALINFPWIWMKVNWSWQVYLHYIINLKTLNLIIHTWKIKLRPQFFQIMKNVRFLVHNMSKYAQNFYCP